MSPLTLRDRELVALGAALAANCVSCVEYHVPKAREAGISDAELTEVLALADQIRQVPARKVLETATRAVVGSNENEPRSTMGQCAEMMGTMSKDGSCC